MNKYTFSSEVELGKFLASTDIIQYAYQAILETTLTYELHKSPSGIKVLAFNCSSNHTTRFLNGEFDLVQSENIQVVDFIPTKVNPKFGINKAAVELFDGLSNDLKELENQHLKTPLIITGSGLGGYLAILSTLRLQRAVDFEESNGSKNTKRPICITFGSPLIGDAAFQEAIFERPQWKSSFLNVVAKNDPVASFFTSKTSYKPIGTYLICTESGGHTAFEDQDSVLAVLDAMASSNAGNKDIFNYTNVLGSIRKKVLYRGVSEFGHYNLNFLRAGITLQFKEVGMLENISDDLIEKMETKKATMIRKKNVYEPTKKLNDSKISLTHMELYMKSTKLKGGYYDSYKKPQSRDEITKHQIILTHQRSLNQYYKKFVDDKNKMPQKEGAKLRKRWLYSGNNYRMIVEPLDIAEYYKKGNTNYIENRPNHYKLLEIWLNEDMKDSKPRDPKTKAASLTEDSCFWAHVEEALISLNKLRNGGLSNNAADIEQIKLKEFEDKVMCAINEFTVSPDIFLNGSSFMKWWNEYKEYKGRSYASEFTEYMNKETYKSYK